MASLDQRLKELERAQLDRAAQCFWCECERDGKSTEKPCFHQSWPRIPHEQALAELAQGARA